ncbi:hypothetical protein FGO68_gene12287 [Halteria grandinella]|uniref:Uncharacterized protein n=1 Tax=Halteria grandinella TaxID=5974 RepID=A0A8J8T6B8_HALGN|nr:hypothetical protein FGO68_gene12287 [Halteria grandinella]
MSSSVKQIDAYLIGPTQWVISLKTTSFADFPNYIRKLFLHFGIALNCLLQKRFFKWTCKIICRLLKSETKGN